MTVNVTGQYNRVMVERRVFGIKPEQLSECDLPASDEPLGVLLTDPQYVDAYYRTHIAELHKAGQRHNTANCPLCEGSPVRTQ